MFYPVTKKKLGSNVISENGVFKFWNGDLYAGGFHAKSPTSLCRHGYGTYFCADKGVLTGHWDEDKLIYGKITYPNNIVYTGSLEDGKYEYGGIYSIPGVGNIYSSFTSNMPIDEILLGDVNGYLWKGTVSNNRSTLYPVNHFLDNPSGRGLPEWPDTRRQPLVDPARNTSMASVAARRKSKRISTVLPPSSSHAV